MLMKDSKKNVAAIIVSKMGSPDSEKPMHEGAEQDSELGLMSASKDLMAAIESKDVMAIKNALKSFVEMCDYSEPEQD